MGAGRGRCPWRSWRTLGRRWLWRARPRAARRYGPGGRRRRGGRAPSPRLPVGRGELRAVGARGVGGELCEAKADGTPPPSLSVFSPRALGAGSGACGGSVSPRGPPSLPLSLWGGPCAPLPAGALTHGRGRPGFPAPGLGARSTEPARASPSAPCLPREGVTCGRAGRFVLERCLVTVTESFPSRGGPAVSARPALAHLAPCSRG